MAARERMRITPAEFRALPETMQRTELIEGELIVSPAPVHKHQFVMARILIWLDQLISGGRITGEVVISPMDVWLGDDCVQPDVFWVSAGGLCRLGQDGYWYGAPDLVVEVLSPATAHRDRGLKFSLYEKHGVREYWLVDPEGRYIEVYQRSAERFARLGVFAPGQTFVSVLLGGAALDPAALLPA